jgi:predicted RNA-binding Zn-ribbon protein involved in translation (DUF1610 family)
MIGLLKRIGWRLRGVGYRCDDCGRWTPRGRGKAQVTTEMRDVPVVPLPRKPFTMVAPGFDPRADARANAILAGLRSGRTLRQLFTVLRCPDCVDQLATRRIAEAVETVLPIFRELAGMADHAA